MGPRGRGDEVAHRAPTAGDLATVHAHVRAAEHGARDDELKLFVRTPLAPRATAAADFRVLGTGALSLAWPTCRAGDEGGRYGR